MIMNMLNVRIGMTFSGGAIDYTLFGILPGINGDFDNNWYWVIIVGLVLAVVYYFLFRFMIRKFDLKTPGREEDDDEAEEVKVSGSELAILIMAALGGKDNLVTIDACITRLRLEVKDVNAVNNKELKRLGASGVLKVGTNGVQAIFWSKSSIYSPRFKRYVNLDLSQITCKLYS